MAEQNMCRMTQLRLRYGISQADLANAAGVSRQLISLIELDTAIRRQRQMCIRDSCHRFPAGGA